MKHHNKWMDGQWMTYNTNREDFIHEKKRRFKMMIKNSSCWQVKLPPKQRAILFYSVMYTTMYSLLTLA